MMKSEDCEAAKSRIYVHQNKRLHGGLEHEKLFDKTIFNDDNTLVIRKYKTY